MKSPVVLHVGADFPAQDVYVSRSRELVTIHQRLDGGGYLSSTYGPGGILEGPYVLSDCGCP